MKKSFSVVLLFVVMLAAEGFAQQRLWLSRYWDGCKPTCSWYKNIPENSQYGLCKSCDFNDNELPFGDLNESISSCTYGGQGIAYTCWDQIPFVDPDNPNIAYGFGATNSIQCGECFELTFDGGMYMQSENNRPRKTHEALAATDPISGQRKKLILMGRNTGGDVQEGQIDFLVPGGGLGAFDSFSQQIGLSNQLNAYPEILGPSFGGLLNLCESGFDHAGANTSLNDWQSCLRQKCNSVFNKPEHDMLKQGCLFYADWMMAANNPTATFLPVPCPQILVDKYIPQSAKWSIYRKAPTFTSKTGDMNINPSNQTVGGISVGSTITYDNVTAKYAGQYDMGFAIQSGQPMDISVTVNDQLAGKIIYDGSQGYSTFHLADGPTVTLKEGTNKIMFTFNAGAGSNIDYFILTGDEDVVKQATGGNGQNSIRPRAASVAKSSRSNVTLKSAPNGFIAMLPAGHSYTSYQLIDLQGREIRRGRVEKGIADLRFNNLRNGVVFLRLSGHGRPQTILQATVAR